MTRARDSSLPARVESLPSCPTNATSSLPPSISIAFTEGLLALNERLLRAYDTEARPSAEELEAMRDGVVRWREQLEGFKQRVTAATVLGDGPLPLQ